MLVLAAPLTSVSLSKNEFFDRLSGSEVSPSRGDLDHSFDGFADTVYSPVVTQNLHNGIQVRGVGLAGNSLADDGGNICHSTLEGGGISLISLHIGGKADFLCQSLDLVEPNSSIIVDVEFLQETVENIHDSGTVKLLVKNRSGQILVIEESACSLAKEIGSSDFQVRSWVKIYLAEGEAGLELKKKPGNPLLRYERRKELTYEEQLQYQIELLKRELVKKEAEVLRLKKLNERKGGGAQRK